MTTGAATGSDSEPDASTDRLRNIDALVDEASMESFPASDPPSYWGRRASETYPDVVTVADEKQEGEEGMT